MQRLTELQRRFLEDHRPLIRGLKGILAAMEEDDLSTAAELARQLDVDVGPHMAFEEEVLYPRLTETYGDEFVVRLVSEHEAGHRALRRLLDLPPGTSLGEGERREILADLQTVLDHALGCGRLVSELVESEEVQQADLATLDAYRQRGTSWSERSYGDAGSA